MFSNRFCSWGAGRLELSGSKIVKKLTTKYLAWAVTLAASTIAAPCAAATLIADPDYTLRGASGVIVNGNTYDVSFVDGTCAQVFGGCDSSSDFVFQTSGDAIAAAQALFNQVFVDLPGTPQYYDGNPSRTAGCNSSPCSVFIPFAVGSNTFEFAAASNGSFENSDAILWRTTSPCARAI